MNNKMMKLFLRIVFLPITIWIVIFKSKKLNMINKVIILTIYSLLLIVVTYASEESQDGELYKSNDIVSETIINETPSFNKDKLKDGVSTIVISDEETNKEYKNRITPKEETFITEESSNDESDVIGTSNKIKVSGFSSKQKSEMFEGYTLIEVAGGDLSGSRQSNVVVDIGFGERQYFAFTNEYGQLIKVVANEIVLQNDSIEEVTSEGRYYHDEAKVPGSEAANLDEGHVIADSLGGVSNAYNITPQDSTLNRHGDQAYMESVIRDAGGCNDFIAIITYSDIYTQIPQHYSFTYNIKGTVIHDEFDNVNPDEMNMKIEEEKAQNMIETTVSVAEAKAAGFKMPISSEHWLYQYMIDRDGDGMVGE